MRFTRRLLVASALLFAGLSSAQAQGYPDQPIKMIIGFAAGGPTDMGGRILAKELSAALGQNVVVDNKPGASGLIGLDALSSAKPDGYTILLMPNATSVALLAQNKPLDIDKRMTVIGGTIVQPMVVVVNPKVVDVKNLKELEAYFKAHPGTPYTTSGHGGPSHVVMTVLAKRRGLNIVHIPHKGIQPALLDTVAGRIGVLLTDAAQSGPHVKSGVLRPIASGGTVRSPAYPDVAMAAEQGVDDFEYDSTNALAAPPGTPPAVMQKLRAALKKAVESEAYTRFASDGGNKAVFTDGPEFRNVLEKDYNRWARLMKEAGELK
ncbi:Bug family tripartite tricarboxylate transporter substrate binding protein [Ramlibacter sp.]|uniref:Bug family tripartite tricarboxylate transporter substrate binding protein n=1 Tax=Ramlibacter sp. TaxID=1917967 RepID=UPI003D146F24